jgi:hypothetical protein
MLHAAFSRRISVAGATAALSFLIFAAGSATPPPASAQAPSSDDSYAAPTNAPAKKSGRNDAYSPPPDKQTFFPQMGDSPVPAPAPESNSGTRWRREEAPVAPANAAPPATRYDSGSGAPAQNAVMRDVLPVPVERGDLAPVMSTDGSGLPYELWKGIDVPALEKLIASIEIPPRSPALHQLWKRLITSTAGDSSNAAFMALRLEALYRSGLARDAAAEIAKDPAAATDPLLLTLEARNELASGHSEKACQMVASAASQHGNIPARLKGQVILMAGYCSAVRDDAAAAGLAADMAREEGVEPSPGLQALDAISIKAKPKFTVPKQISLLDYRIAQRVGGLSPKTILEKGEPALLVALATDPTTPVDLGLPATEAAARLNALAPNTLAAIYRVNAQAASPDDLLSGKGPQGVARRAALFKAAESEQAPGQKARLIRAFLDDAKHEGLAMMADQMIAPTAALVRPERDVGWFAETAIEIALASGRYDMARAWIALGDEPGRGAGGLGYWRALADIADPNDPQRGASLPILENYVGKFSAPTLQRLATVLVALDYLVPIPLWEAANRGPQSNSGYLPETGVLSELQDASKKQEFGRTVLLVMKALGPNGAEVAHLIALGDSIRALKRAGLEADARRLGFEALLPTWPHTETN